MGAHTEIHGADIGEVGRATSIGLERIDEPALNMFVNGANSFPMKSNGFSMGSIWIPINCLTDFHMESDGFPIDLNLDSVRFSCEFPYGFQSIPCGLHE